MTRNLRRIEALEQQGSRERLHCIIRFADQTEAEATAAYENNNGPIGPDDGSILRVIINKFGPAPREA